MSYLTYIIITTARNEQLLKELIRRTSNQPFALFSKRIEWMTSKSYIEAIDITDGLQLKTLPDGTLTLKFFNQYPLEFIDEYGLKYRGGTWDSKLAPFTRESRVLVNGRIWMRASVAFQAMGLDRSIITSAKMLNEVILSKRLPITIENA